MQKQKHNKTKCPTKVYEEDIILNFIEEVEEEDLTLVTARPKTFYDFLLSMDDK